MHVLFCLKQLRRIVFHRKLKRLQAFLDVLLALGKEGKLFFVFLGFAQGIGVAGLGAFHGMTFPGKVLLGVSEIGFGTVKLRLGFNGCLMGLAQNRCLGLLGILVGQQLLGQICQL